jgi:hypothetical protein
MNSRRVKPAQKLLCVTSDFRRVVRKPFWHFTHRRLVVLTGVSGQTISSTCKGHSSLDSSLEVRLKIFLETSVTNYQSSLRETPEEKRSQKITFLASKSLLNSSYKI